MLSKSEWGKGGGPRMGGGGDVVLMKGESCAWEVYALVGKTFCPSRFIIDGRYVKEI